MDHDLDFDVSGFAMYEAPMDKHEKRNRQIIFVPAIEKNKGEKRNYNYKACKIEDARFIINKHQSELVKNYRHNEINFLKKSRPRSFKHKSFNMALTKILKVTYRHHNNVCILNFDKFNWNKERTSLTVYGYCSHLTCNSYKFFAKYIGDIIEVKCFRNKLSTATHPYEKQLTSQIRNIDRLTMIQKLMYRKADDVKTEMDVNLSKDLCEAGTVNSKNRKVLDKTRSEYLRALLKDRDQSLDLLAMSNSTPEIERVSFFPLTVIIVMHKLVELLRKNEFYKTIHIDGTGSVIKFSKAKSKVLVYDLLLRHKKKGTSIPLSHLISESHAATDLESWLQTVKYIAETSSKKITDFIKRAVVDWSYAIILGEYDILGSFFKL